MLSVSNISKTFGNKAVLKNVSFSIKSGSRVALVGPNGCGKTTLLRILVNQEKPDSGAIRLSPVTTTIGYLPQGLEFSDHDTIRNYLGRHHTDITTLSRRLEELSIEIEHENPSESVKKEYDATLTQISTAAQDEYRVNSILEGLGLDSFSPSTLVHHLSGGQKTRLALAIVLLDNPDFLILDEPTNHLDIQMLEWMEDWLNNLPVSMLIVSHDRAFLDNVATTVLELDPLSGSTHEYPGNYSAYLTQKAAERERNWRNFQDQQDEIARLHQTVSHLQGLAKFRKGGKADTGDKFARGFFANRALGTAGRAKHLEHRIDRLLNEDHIDKPSQTWHMKVDFDDVPDSGRDVFIIENANIGFPEHEPLLSRVNVTLRYGQRVALIGPNGSGKTTLLRTITGRLNPLEGCIKIGSNVNIGYMAQEHENLDFKVDALTSITHIKPLPETEIRSFLSKFLFKGDDVFTPIEQMSYGERSRLSFAILVARGCNFLILDEPINHLDIPARLKFEEALKKFDGSVLAVVHDRYFITNFASAVWEVKDHTIRIIS